jgi:Flp pilus assembly protein TadG
MATVGLAVMKLHRPLLRSSSSRQPCRRRRPNGQAMVEFALVAPLFFALIFGLIEFALIGVSISSYNLAAEEGARIGSVLGRTDPTVDQQIVAAVRAHTSGIAAAQTVEIEVFKADVTGHPVISGGNITENVYDIQGNTINPTGTVPWPYDLRIDQLLTADYLGVRITYQYTYLTAFIAGGNSHLQLTATSVQRIEPQDYQGRLTEPSPATPSQATARVPVEGYLPGLLAWAAAFVGRRRLGEGI